MASGRLQTRIRTEGPQILRIVVAAALSWQVCVWLGATEPPVFAVVVPLVAVRDHPYSVVNLSFDRMIGVIGGVLLAELTVRLLGISLLSVTAVLAVGLTVGLVLRVGTALNVQIAVSAMLVFASAEPDAYALTRIWETAIGAVVSVLLSPLLLPPNARKAFEAELAAVTAALSDQLDTLRAALGGARNDEVLVELRGRAARTEEAARELPTTLATAERAVRHNPLRRADLPRLAARADQVRLVVEVARVERLLLDEVVDLSTRTDLREVWPELQSPLLRVLEPAAAAVRLRLEARPADPTLADLRARGDAEILLWRSADQRPIAAVMRRPLRRLFDVLGPDPTN